jgi:hypothetical protein
MDYQYESNDEGNDEIHGQTVKHEDYDADDSKEKSFSSWAKHEPRHDQDKVCVQICANNGYMWRTYDCASEEAFVCEWNK